MGRDVGGSHQEAGGVFVQTMHQASARHVGEFGPSCQQAVHQSAAGVAGARMDHQAGWFVHDDHALVCIDNGEIQLLRGLPVHLPSALGANVNMAFAADLGVWLY